MGLDSVLKYQQPLQINASKFTCPIKFFPRPQGYVWIKNLVRKSEMKKLEGPKPKIQNLSAIACLPSLSLVIVVFVARLLV